MRETTDPPQERKSLSSLTSCLLFGLLILCYDLKLFSYASSSTLHPRQSVSQ